MRSRGRPMRSRGRSARPLGRSTGPADRQMTGPEEALLGAPLEDFKLGRAGRRRCRSGSMAVEPQPAGRQLGTGMHPAPSVPAGIRADRPVRQVVSAAMRVAPAAGRVGSAAGPVACAASPADLAAGRVVRAARRARPETEAATPARAAPATGTAPRAALGRTARLARPGLPRPLRVGRRRRAGAVSPATVSGSWITKNRLLRRSGQRCGRAPSPRVDAPRAAPERAGRRGEREGAEMLVVRRLAVRGPGARQPKCRLDARPLHVLRRRSYPLRGRSQQDKSWRDRQATRTAATRTGR
jgi:hypothetical protein